MSFYEIDGVKPVIDDSSFVHPTASIIGHVIIGKNCYIGPHASLRGDYGRIVLEDGVNVQDGCIAHCFPGGETRIRKNGHISHGAVLHGCVIGENTMVGIQTVIMDNAEIGAECIIGALSYVKPGFKAPDRSIVHGSPAEVKRAVKDHELEWKTRGTQVYQNLTERYLKSFRACQPLNHKSLQKQTLDVPKFKPMK
ncbi:MAG: transferase hexapeptide repeat family protein [Proteobacteria bacterium]|nr:MAG: transferase hexapeptide repeat family protein [Pseudomonadota bacterium]